ncbi:DUF3492 domain-containing protein [Streptomyces sp. CBMA152]|uniref:DUF3492 domain-containing protein n=1 Tax=Streptomyces sp. CBMA152 TaxID=1896312 RepID=UPI001CB6FFE3|nr:DUF3492 domain-containing protein [Streptomyces sp. CBMA152]
MRIGLLTDGGYPYTTGESRLWCDRLVRGLARHEFDIYALSRTAAQEERGWVALPPHVRRVRTAPLWAPEECANPRFDRRGYGRRERTRFAGCFRELAGAICGDGVGTSPGAPSAQGTRGRSAAAGLAADAARTFGEFGLAAGGGGVFGVAGPGADAAGAEAPSVPVTGASRFAEGLYGLADLARECGGLHTALRSETAVRVLEAACRAPGASRAVQAARVPDYLAFADLLERALRPLSLDWYDAASLGDVDLCHAAGGGSAALPGLLAKRFFGVPLLVTEYGVQLRRQYLAAREARVPVRALLAAFHRRLAAEVYDRAALITPGNTHTRRWQEKCGADRVKLRTVYPGMAADRFQAVGEGPSGGDPGTLVWVGRVDPTKDLIALLHAFTEVRRKEPDARLRIFYAGAGAVSGAVGSGESGTASYDVGAQGSGAFGPAPYSAASYSAAHGYASPHGYGAGAGSGGLSPESAAYLAHCRALAAQLFPDEAADAHAVGDNPVSFEEIGGPEAPDLADAYASGSVVVLSSVVEGFPISLVEAMFCGRATVSTDAGAVVEVIGGTGLVVPPRNPRALADACVALLRDPERRERLGAAARARALELFTVEQNLAAFRGIYLELMSHCPVRREELDDSADPVPFAHPAEAHVPGNWAASGTTGPAAGHAPSWADPGTRARRTPGAGAVRDTLGDVDRDSAVAAGSTLPADSDSRNGSSHSATWHSGLSRPTPGDSDPNVPGPTAPDSDPDSDPDAGRAEVRPPHSPPPLSSPSSDIGRSGSARAEEATR